MTTEPIPIPMTKQAQVRTVEELVETARALVQPGGRRFLGITGAPGAGKSTLAERVVAELGADAVLVGMDGFHLRNDELARLGRSDRKGAIDTFDAAGYVHLLQRLRARTEPVVYAPVFDRGLDESIGSAQPVPAQVPLVVTEGNYLLVDATPWDRIRGLLDASWFVDPGEDTRQAWLLARHVRFGRTPEQARERTLGSDGANALLITGTRERASMIVQVPRLTEPA